MVSDASLSPEEADNSGSLTPQQRKRLSSRPSDRAIVGTLALSGLIVAFLQTLVTPVIPDLPHLLSTTTADASWVLSSTLLAAAITTPISGRRSCAAPVSASARSAAMAARSAADRPCQSASPIRSTTCPTPTRTGVVTSISG